LQPDRDSPLDGRDRGRRTTTGSCAVFRDEMKPHFREQLIDLWDGKLFQQREVLNYALDGTKLP